MNSYTDNVATLNENLVHRFSEQISLELMSIVTKIFINRCVVRHKDIYVDNIFTSSTESNPFLLYNVLLSGARQYSVCMLKEREEV